MVFENGSWQPLVDTSMDNGADDADDDVLVVGGLFHTGVLTCLALADGIADRVVGGRWPAWAAAFRRRG